MTLEPQAWRTLATRREFRNRWVGVVADTVQQVAADVVGQAADLRIAIRGRRAPRIKRARRD